MFDSRQTLEEIVPLENVADQCLRTLAQHDRWHLCPARCFLNYAEASHAEQVCATTRRNPITSNDDTSQASKFGCRVCQSVACSVGRVTSDRLPPRAARIIRYVFDSDARDCPSSTTQGVSGQAARQSSTKNGKCPRAENKLEGTPLLCGFQCRWTNGGVNVSADRFQLTSAN